MVKTLKELCFKYFYLNGISKNQKEKLPIDLKNELSEYIKNQQTYSCRRRRYYRSSNKQCVADRCKKSIRISKR